MIRIDAYFFYQVGAALRPLLRVQNSISKENIRPILWSSHYWLNSLLKNSIYRLTTCLISGNELLGSLERINDQYGKDGVDLAEQINLFDYYDITTQAQKFEAVLSAELQWGNLYLVQPKGGFDLNQLTENGISIFPYDLPSKVPESISDAREAARCIAFELPTAAAFHLHRLNELVLRRFYDQVTGGKPRPEHRNIGAYIDAMKNYLFIDKKLFGALAMVKDFHRNPVLHPDDRLESVQDAIALHGIVNTTVSYMLDTLSFPELVLEPSPNENATIEATETRAITDATNAV